MSEQERQAALATELVRLLPAAEIRLNEPMSRHTTMQVGGPAELFVEPAGQEELLRLLGWCRARELTFLLIGEGSNLIVRDGGFPGLVIRVGQGLAKVSVSGRLILAEAGVRLAELARTAAAAGLSGLEFAVGIPGSLGGGLFMNAGAYGGELGGLVRQCKVVTETGEVRCLSGGEMEFGYRHSVLQERPWYALEATLELAPGDPEAIAARMSDLTAQREAKQPLELPSAGSVFRRPEGYYVGKLVEEAGLRGFRIGGAQVSEKHTGFIVNTGGATAGEVVALIRHIQTVVRDRFGVSLEPEARIVGEDLR